MAAPIRNAEHAKKFILAGNATVTLKSAPSGKHYTYHVKKSDDDERPVWFISVLTGPDDFRYIGMVKNGAFIVTKKSALPATSPAVAGFRWFVDNLLYRGGISTTVEVWHEGKCGRCARALTHPASILTGFGPDCAERLGIICEAV